MTAPTSRTIHGDCLEVMAAMEPCSVDAIVTDPPYGLAFMGKEWDHGVPGVPFWEAALRVLKPGGHLIAFSGSRTYHRLACCVEDAGFEIRDQILWVYGSGFPKSMDISKAIDKAAGAEREVVGSRVADDIRGGNMHAVNRGERHVINITAPATPEAQEWAGWGTALKPAHEPAVLARKPFSGTVAANVLRHGTGGINVDGCRVEHDEECRMMAPSQANINNPSEKCQQAGRREAVLELKPGGRWPANLIHDGSDDVVALFPQTNGQMGKSSDSQRTQANCYGTTTDNGKEYTPRGDTGSAARFFYTAKASRAERGKGNNHPTVKPIDLMAYLCRLVTPPGGVVLDPFCGSGTTLKAALSEGFSAVGIEKDAAYFQIIEARMDGAQIGLGLGPALG
jgi:site-specific DNA-methyltransferase (adenine-specific)